MSTAQSEGGLLLVPSSSLKGDYDGESGKDERDRTSSLASRTDSERVDGSTTRISSCATLDMLGTSESLKTTQNGPPENCFMNIANDPNNLRNADSGTVVGVRGANTSLVTTNCQASSANSFITVMSRPSLLSPNTSEARICITGTAPVKVATSPPPVGTWLIPTGYNDGYAKPGPASHPQAFAVVESYAGDTVIARLVERHPASKNFTNLPLTTNAHYVESHACGDEDDERELLLSEYGIQDQQNEDVGGRDRFHPMIVFITAVLCLLGASVALLIRFLPRHGATNYNLHCNLTAAVECEALSGEFNNQCHAMYTGMIDAQERCCASPAAYGCFSEAFCELFCTDNGTVDMSLDHDWGTAKAFESEIVTQLNPPPGTVIVTNLTKTSAAVEFHDRVANLFLNRVSNNTRDPLYNILHISSAPWTNAGTAELGSLLVDQFINNGTDTSSFNSLGWSSADVFCNYTNMTVFVCLFNGKKKGPENGKVLQSVNTSLYPDTATWTLSGWYGIESTDKSVSSAVMIKLVLRNIHGGIVDTLHPSMISAEDTNTWYPTYLPFFWSGRIKKQAVTATVELTREHIGDLPRDVYLRTYFENVTLTPGGPSCENVELCEPLRCEGSFNKTHDVCFTSLARRGGEGAPFSLPSIDSNISVYHVSGIIDTTVKTGPLLAIVEGNVTAELKSSPRHIKVSDSEGNPVQMACASDELCSNVFPAGRSFIYKFQLFPDKNGIPSTVFDWRILSDEDPNFIIQLTWYAAAEPPPIMDIT
eukprot:TRINITY_DN790_c3_g1_i2.p1 TRINITY_DN790_c3_g1~~TRINITY_DN790_c3_g1_i2.p1  ORF type:complete len:765 (+),score=120.91 TRINITY_DN790_c3_g1_i2:139-2433(+)